MENNERYERTKKRVRDIKSFYGHLAIYVVVMAFLFIIDIMNGGGLWFFWPALGWGIAIAFHAMGVFGNLWGSDWEERKTRELMEKESEMSERRGS